MTPTGEAQAPPPALALALPAGASHMRRLDHVGKVAGRPWRTCRSMLQVCCSRVLPTLASAPPPPPPPAACSMRGRFEHMIRGIQKQVCAAIEEVDGNTFRQDAWTRPGGGGGITRVMQASRPRTLPAST